MVDVEYIARSARRHDTAVSRAFLKALRVRKAKRRDARRSKMMRDRESYAGVRSCFRNFGSPMDGRR